MVCNASVTSLLFFWINYVRVCSCKATAENNWQWNRLLPASQHMSVRNTQQFHILLAHRNDDLTCRRLTFLPTLESKVVVFSNSSTEDSQHLLSCFSSFPRLELCRCKPWVNGADAMPYSLFIKWNSPKQGIKKNLRLKGFKRDYLPLLRPSWGPRIVEVLQ